MAFPRAFSTLPASPSNVLVFNGHFMRFYPNLVAEVWFAYPKDPASWGELQADYDSDSTMNVHEKVHMTIRLNMIGPQMIKLFGYKGWLQVCSPVISNRSGLRGPHR